MAVCPKCGAYMVGNTSGWHCPRCGYYEPYGDRKTWVN